MNTDDDEEQANDDDEDPTNSEIILDNGDLNKDGQENQPDLIEEKDMVAFENQPGLVSV